jgi:hypothetical protein
MPFVFKSREQEGKIGPICRLVPVGSGRIYRKGEYTLYSEKTEYSGNIIYLCMKMEK